MTLVEMKSSTLLVGKKSLDTETQAIPLKGIRINIEIAHQVDRRIEVEVPAGNRLDWTILKSCHAYVK